jgi:hypothetical protein
MCSGRLGWRFGRVDNLSSNVDDFIQLLPQKHLLCLTLPLLAIFRKLG